jgi:hypothetical protein
MMKILKILRMRWDKAYVSPIDLFQKSFDASHEKSASQKAEIKKYQRIHALRDKAVRSAKEDT